MPLETAGTARTCFALALILVAGCSTDRVRIEAGAPEDAAVDLSRSMDAALAADFGVRDLAAVADGPIADLSVKADGPPTDLAVSRDLASGDMSKITDLSVAPVPDGGFGPVQCRVNADCRGPIASCNRDAPGGICLGCGSDGDCVNADSCVSGACVRLCNTVADCNAGFTCSSSGRCLLRSCPCPAPYVCDSNNRCARPACNAGACPSPLVCNAGVCVEP